MPAKKTIEEFIANARKVHGDKYDYSKVVYQGGDKKVCIICPEHGEFAQTPHSHLQGQECPICGRIKCDEHRKKGIKVFLEQAYAAHGDRYDYSKVELKTRNKPVCIICREHGDFWQAPSNHVNGQGCPKCARRLVGKKNNKHTAWFLEKAKAIHGDKYDYSQAKYIKATENVCVICHEKDDGGFEHGPFWLRASEHLKGNGCPKCGHPKHTLEWFVQQGLDIYGKRYDYSKTKYVNSSTRVTITCQEHGDFKIFPSSFYKGVGCPKCSGRGLTTADFIELARQVHGDKYEYDKVIYVNKTTPITITCPLHGDFQQTPFNHLRGSGCIKCHIDSRTNDQDAFLARARAVHGNKYDYSKAQYVNTHTKVCVICPTHGEFWVTPGNHLRGVNCPTCVRHKQNDTLLFIEEAKKVHGDRYDYSQVEYKTIKDKVCIICPEHGAFWQRPSSHLRGAVCPDCSRLKPITEEVFKSHSTIVHGGKYDYSKVHFNSVNEKVCIICPTHGEFWQSASSHMHGYSCPKCSGKYMDTEYFKEKSSVVHGGKYDYSKTVFTGAFNKVIITCPIHGDFEQVASYHLAGNGCPACSESQLEKAVRGLLKRHHIKFESQKTFDWLRYDGKMFLDFFLPDHGVAVECQGEQHFVPIDYFEGEAGYRRTVARDETKKQLCGSHGIQVVYNSDLGIDYPYPVIENLGQLLETIKSHGKVDPGKWKDPELPFNFSNNA